MPTLTKSTKPVSAKTITRGWHLVDVKCKILGRAIPEIVGFLTGKNKSSYAPNLDMGDHVVVINARHVKVTGHKESDKIYSRYSGYPSGLRQATFAEMIVKKPTEVIRHAVMGMLPKNKLRDRRITRLFIYADDKHPYGEKLAVNPSAK